MHIHTYKQAQHQNAQMKEADRQRHVRPTTTLFVVNFDASRTRTRDLERMYEKYGDLTRVEIKKNYAFVQVRLHTAVFLKYSRHHFYCGFNSNRSNNLRL
jgi:hypothetical protein